MSDPFAIATDYLIAHGESGILHVVRSGDRWFCSITSSDENGEIVGPFIGYGGSAVESVTVALTKATGGSRWTR